MPGRLMPTDHITTCVVALLPDDCGLGLARRRLADGEPLVARAAVHLRMRGERALRVAPLSVIDDADTAPSGDRRDYTSRGPYWWPDPDQADGLPYIRRDGERNPESVRGDQVALSTASETATILIHAYALLGEMRFAEHAGRILRRFFLDPDAGMRPHLRYAQAIPGHCEGRSIGLIDTHFLVPLAEALPLLDGARGWSLQDAEAMRQWFADYLQWFTTSQHGHGEAREQNNHGSWWDTQAVAFALCIDDRVTARRILEAVPNRRIDAQIAGDGGQPHELGRTQSITYSLFNLQALTALAVMGQRVEIDLWHYRNQAGGGIAAALRFFEPYVRGLPWPWTQLSPPSWHKLSAMLRLAAISLDEPDFAPFLASMATPSLPVQPFELLYPKP